MSASVAKALFFAALSLLAVSPLGAQEPPSAAGSARKLEEARRLLQEARAQRAARRFDEATATFERVLRLLEENGATKEELGGALNSLGFCHYENGRLAAALAAFERALGLFRELHAGDHPDVARVLDNVASMLDPLGRSAEALPLREESLSIRRRLFPGDHPEVAEGTNNLAYTLENLGRETEALPLYQESLAMRRRLFPGDHPAVADGLDNAATALDALGRIAEALPLREESLAMRWRLFRGDHPKVALGLNNMAFTLDALGRRADALPLYEQSLAMYRRLFQGDHPSVASGIENVATAVDFLGRPGDALPLREEALAMYRRLFPGDHPEVALSLNNLAFTLGGLGRPTEALPLYEESLAMWRRLFPGDHPDVARGLDNVAGALDALGRRAAALPLREESLAMYRRLFPGDHPSVALGLNNVAGTLDVLGRSDEALPLRREAAEMGRRVGWSDRHLPLVALGAGALARGDAAGALAFVAEAADHAEALRAQARTLGTEAGARYVAWIRRNDPFPLLAEALVALGRPREALECVERGRARAVLDLLEEGRGDPLAEAEARASAAGDGAAVARLAAATRAVAAAESAVVVRAKASERAFAGGVRGEIGAAIDAEGEARRALERARRDRLQLLRDVLPETRPLGAAGIQALLRPGERALAYALGERASFVFLVRPEGEGIEAVRLAAGLADVERSVAAQVASVARPGGDPAAGRRLFEAVVPAKVWEEVKAAKRVYVLPHGPLHRISFETLVVAAGPRYWVDEAPPVAYASSASVLAWLVGRPDARPAGAPDLVAVGDPHFEATAAPWPDKGVVVRDVTPDGQAAALGLRSGDVLVGYGDREVPDPAALRAALGSAGETDVALRFVRDGTERTVMAKPGRLGAYLAEEPPPISGPALLAERGAPRLLRGGALAPLPGTRSEVEGIRKAFGDATVVTLLGEEATEERVYAAARNPRYLHLATHGIVDETRSASLSALALARPRVPVPGDDGYLTLADLLERWRHRLDGAALVVLSACDSQKGKLERDEGMLSLPLGFSFAGARAVIASLWKVDDDSTALLMSDLYRRMLAEGAPDPCAALQAARRELRKTRPDPCHWGAFVYFGAP